jgi:hypothetical protein
MSFAYSPSKPKSLRPLTRLAPQKETMVKRIGAIDLETGGLRGEPVLLGQMYHEQWSQARIYRTCEELLDDLFSLPVKSLKNTVWYSHNAEFDWRYLIEPMRKYRDKFFLIPCERCEGSFFEIKVMSVTERTAKDEPVLITTFRDSMALFGEGLEKFTKHFADTQFHKQDIGLGKGVKFNPDDPVHIEYAKNDVLGLVSALINFDRIIYKNYKVHIKGTIASTAFAAWQVTIPEGEYHDRVGANAEAFIRKCYFGGLVQLNCPVKKLLDNVVTFDRNSSYPAVMRFGVPFGRAQFTWKRVDGKPGFHRVTAHVPKDMILPIVPHRNADDEICWPTGTFETFMSTIEIDYMTERGARFDVHEGYFFPKGLSFCFSDFVDKCERLRTETKGTPAEKVVKLMQNSVYGRFGMKPEGKECVLSFDGMPEGFAPNIDEETGELSEIFFFKKMTRTTNYMLPHYAAWITAHARIELDKDTEALGRELCRYRDTDSASIEAEEVTCDRVGLVYGQLKNEGLKKDVLYIGPKAYIWRDPKKGVLDGRMKGIPERQKTGEFLSKVMAGESPLVTYLSVSGLQTYMKTDRMATDRKRTISKPENVYGHAIDERGWFRPKHLELMNGVS